MVNDDGAARRQVDRAGIGRLDLVLDLEAAEQRCFVAVALDPGRMLGHDVGHELLRLVVNVISVDQDVADVIVEIVADGTDHQAGFLVNQESAFGLAGAVNRSPELEQVVQVPLQLGGTAANTGGAGDDGHAVGVFQLVHGFFEFSPVVTLDAATDAATPGVVGHQHHIATGQTDEGGEGRAFVAALLFFHLDQQVLAFFDDVLDAGLRGRHIAREVLLGDFFERQKTVAFFAVIDKTGFQRGFNPGHHRFVDVALALFAPFNFDFVVEEFLSVDDGQAALFSLRGVDQHPFHDAFLFLLTTQVHGGPTMPWANARKNERECRVERARAPG